MAKPWQRVSREIDRKYRLFDVVIERHISPRNAHPCDALTLETCDWVNVIALTPVDEVVLIQQYRFGLAAVTLEIPGGLLDPSENAAEAAARELREETGYAAAKVTSLGTVAPNPAFLRNRLHCFLAEGCTLVGHQEQDANEDISVELRPLSQIDALLASGEIEHALVQVAFHKLALLRAGFTLK